MSTTPRRWRLADLSVGFVGRPVVEHIDLTVAAGELLVVTGANGAGKSCLLRTLSGELAPLAGAIHAPAGFAADGLGVVSQVTDLDPRLPITLGEMAILGLAGQRAPFVRERLAEALATVDLVGRAGQSWNASSGGERQRALVARALVRQPEVLILDEASSHLDECAASVLFDRLGERCAAGHLTVIAAVHDHALARRHGTRHLHLSGGRATLQDVA